ncbi:MAG: NADH:flavin oxidoreductase/NADH oxidase [Burkholderiales bacterium]|nr:NADH:flavin oxidoreductase/NADH oxidase [Burkholderiales bacterium]
MTKLFEPLTLRGVTLPNRIAVSPMCQYTAEDGLANDWHLVHLGTRAVGGAGLVIAEATAVAPEGRISPQDLGIWSETHIASLARITAFIKSQGAVAGVQLAHAGRKASTHRPWSGSGAVPMAQGGWEPVAPSAIRFADDYPMPREMSTDDIAMIPTLFAEAAKRALAAGFELIELHAAHGYLLHQFLSPISNRRTDGYGGSFDNRIRLLLETIEAVRSVWPAQLPIIVRVSATDWAEAGEGGTAWDADQTVDLARRMAALGVDLVDVSSGGMLARAKIPVGPGYQVGFAERIKRETGMATGAVGMITEASQAAAVVDEGHADIVLLARELLRDPYWPLHAAEALGVSPRWPAQYLRAAPATAVAR